MNRYIQGSFELTTDLPFTEHSKGTEIDTLTDIELLDWADQAWEARHNPIESIIASEARAIREVFDFADTLT